VTLAQHPEDVYELLVSYRSGDMWAPRFDTTEALRTEAAHFTDCVAGRARPVTDGRAGLRIVRILEAAELSLRERGRLIELPAEDAIWQREAEPELIGD
jgi:predicted dehydrogenase